jgi:hypothetical protein
MTSSNPSTAKRPAWAVERYICHASVADCWVVKRGSEFLRLAGPFTRIRRFQTKAGADRACSKANRADAVIAEMFAGSTPFDLADLGIRPNLERAQHQRRGAL